MQAYQALLSSWCQAALPYLRKCASHPELLHYGPGESAHWSVQSSMNTLAAYAIAGTEPQWKDMPQGAEWRRIALALFRYAMHTHLTGDTLCTDGKQWGHHWISNLGVERMVHAVNELRPYFTEDDLARWRTMTLDECDWRLENYPVVASIDGSAGKNKPESNIWNGGILLRAAADYPEAPNAARYREYGTKFLLNGLSRESDAANEEMYEGKPVSAWHVGGQFTENWSLDHHGYMNVGYSIICLSNLAMLHYQFLQRGQTPPACLQFHVSDLWKTVRNFIFPDGRLLRLGGDSRNRYTYCQAYALPVFLYAADVLHDPLALQFERGYLGLLQKEAAQNPGQMFYAKRLENVKRTSWYYYTRLESDPALAISCALAWRRRFPIPTDFTPQSNPPCTWHDDFHRTALIRTGNTIRSYTYCGEQSPVALCLPASDSSLAEWQHNLVGYFGMTQTQKVRKTEQVTLQAGPDSFTASALIHWMEEAPSGEGEGKYECIADRHAVAALPDGKSLIILQYAWMLKEQTLFHTRTINLMLPNDVFNGHMRTYAGDNFQAILQSYPSQDELLDTHSRTLVVDGTLAVSLAYGAESLKIKRFAAQPVQNYHARRLTSLYADAICAESLGWRRCLRGEVVADTGVVLTACPDGVPATAERMETEGLLRAVKVHGTDGKTYLFAVNFGTAPTSLPFAELTLAAGEVKLLPLG